MPVDIKTLVPLANTDIISTLAALPANAAATEAISSALAAVPTTGLPAVSEVPTGILPGGLPALTAAPEVSSILEGVSSDAFAKVMSAVASALAQVASAAGGALPTPGAGLPSSVLSALESLPTGSLPVGQVAGAVGSVSGLVAGVVPTGIPAAGSSLPTVGAGLPNVTLPGRTKEEANDAEHPDDVEETKEKRQLDATTGLLSGANSPLAGVQPAVGSLTSGAGLGSAVGNLISNNAMVANVANAVNGLAGGATPLAFLNPLLSTSGGPLGLAATLAGLPTILTSLPLGSITTSSGGIPSILLSTVGTNSLAFVAFS